MKVFFSYGREDNQYIVKKMKDNLEMCGHTVFMDISSIAEGENWRRKITEEIINSDLVFFFAGQHSVRKKGPCSEELRIALNTKGSMIQTVLLEKNIEPPRNVSYNNYIDMSDWKANEFNDSWYNEKFKVFKNIVEDSKINNTIQEIQYIKEQLCPNLFTQRSDNLLEIRYLGRKWLIEKIQEWIKDENKPQIALLEGPPGIGKSAFVAHELSEMEEIGSVIFIQWDHADMNNLDSLSRKLVFQLASRFEHYRFNVKRYLENTVLREIHQKKYKPEENIFKTLFIQQMSQVMDAEHPIVLIVIDAIDELLPENKDILVNSLQNELNEMNCELPKFVKFIITTRNDEDVVNNLKRAVKISMNQDSQENLSDMYEYIKSELDGMCENDIELITKKTAGNFLIGRFLCNAIKEYGMNMNEVESMVEGNLEEFYKKCFQRIFISQKQYRKEYSKIFSVFSVIEEPIPEEIVRKISGKDEWEFEDCLRVLHPYIVFDERYISLYHKTLGEWISSPNAGVYKVWKKYGFQYIADYCFERYQKCNWETLDLYELKYMLPYMKKCEHEHMKSVQNDEIYADFLLKKAKKHQYTDAIQLAEIALEIYSILKKSEKILKTYVLLAEAASMMSQNKKAKKYCMDAKEFAKGVTLNKTMQDSLGEVLLCLGGINWMENKWNQAQEIYDEAYHKFSQCDNYENQVIALIMKGNILRETNLLEQSLTCFENAEKILSNTQHNNLTLKAWLNLNYGWLLHNLSRYKEASEKFITVESLLEENASLLSVHDKAELYFLRARETYNEAQNYELAKTYIDKALYYIKMSYINPVTKSYGAKTVDVGMILNMKGHIEQKIAEKTGEYKDAIASFKESYEKRKREFGADSMAASIALRSYAKVIFKSGENSEYGTMEEMLKTVLKTREKNSVDGKNKGWLAQCYLDFAEYYQEVGKLELAKENIQLAKKLYKEFGTERDMGTCIMREGLIHMAEGEMLKAKTNFEMARTMQREFYEEAHPYIKELNRLIQCCK